MQIGGQSGRQVIEPWILFTLEGTTPIRGDLASSSCHVYGRWATYHPTTRQTLALIADARTVSNRFKSLLTSADHFHPSYNKPAPWAPDKRTGIPSLSLSHYSLLFHVPLLLDSNQQKRSYWIPDNDLNPSNHILSLLFHLSSIIYSLSLSLCLSTCLIRFPSIQIPIRFLASLFHQSLFLGKVSMADMLSNMKEKKSVLEMAIFSAKTRAFLILIGFAVVFASLPVVPSLDLRCSSQGSVLITVHLIIAAIWKLSNAKPRGNHPRDHDNNAGAPPPDSTETWYDVPSSLPTTTSPESKSSPSPPPAAEPVIPPETVEEEAASRPDDGSNSMDATWRAIMDGGGLPAKPMLKKSQTWERRKEVKAVGEKPVVRREMRKSETFKEKAKAIVEEGWRRRDVLVVSQDELFRRVETFIKKHHENLRLQRQESEQRRFFETLRRSH